MSEDAIPFKCRLCGFMCLRKDQILSHTTGYTRHLVAAVKQKVTNSLPYLMESRQPHIFGASDFKALTPEASLLYFLGSGDSELEQKVVAPAAVKQVTEVTQSTIYRPFEMSRLEDTFAPLVPKAANHSAVATLRVPPPTAVPDAFPGVSLQQAGEEPSAGSIISIPEEQQTDIARQLTAFLQSMAGIVQSPLMLSGEWKATSCSHQQRCHNYHSLERNPKDLQVSRRLFHLQRDWKEMSLAEDRRASSQFCNQLD